MAQRKGKYTLILDNPPGIRASAAIGSKKEGEGPLRESFDIINADSYFGQASWEKAESRMQETVVQKALEKAKLSASEIDCIFAGDLLNQCVGSGYGLRSLKIPFVGLYGACSTMAESLLVSSVFLDSGAATKAVACTSSHFCSAERQFRYPLEYGGQRPPTAQWTATASGAAVLENGDFPPFVRAVTVGTIEDLGIKDTNNMGAAMAPAAAMTLKHFFEDTATNAENFDLILTGDLGKIGSQLMRELMQMHGYQLNERYVDCGMMLYDPKTQDVHSGASGCGCSASVLCGHILPLMRAGQLNDVLFMATGALMSPTVVQQGESIASIAHLVYLSSQQQGGRVS